ncbi:MAG TPA: hypothetical protein VMQ65_06355 [Candidatus Limnocylindria bacterium]|nr:hypothetical protein [Candidatus Limnocylindria bacterium]
MVDQAKDTVGIARLHPISRRHLEALSGDLGIMQHAIGTRPDPAHGYCVDDVARALEVDLLHARVLGWPSVADSARRNLRFLEEAFDESTGRFRNFRTVTGEWVAGKQSDDSQGRAMLAIGETIGGAPDDELRDDATRLWDRALPAIGRLTALRAQASVVLGCEAILRVGPNEPARTWLAKFARSIDRRLRGNASSDWFWPEDELTYENALIPRCLIVAGRRLGSADLVGTGVQVVDWLLSVQTSAGGHLSPIGNGWWRRGGVRSRFDQQPIEATALLLAAEAALEATGESRFGASMELAYAWFLGRNDLGRSVANPARGAAFDGLTPSGLNLNQGAESTLMWLIAAEHIRAHRETAAATAKAAETAAQATAPATTASTTVGPGSRDGAAAGAARDHRPAAIHLAAAAS